MTGRSPPRPPHRVTSFDVAERAGVAQPTVSRALNNRPDVSPATRARVIEAARALNYVPDTNALRLRHGRSDTIAVIVVCRPGEGPSAVNPFYFTLLGAIAAAAAERDLAVLVSFQGAADTMFARFEESRQADGTIVIGTTQNEAAWAHFNAGRVWEKAWVCWGAPFDALEWVRSDNEGGGRAAAEHLIATGRRAIAFMGPRESLQRQFAERYAGHAAVLSAHGLIPRLIEVDERLPREEQGAVAARAMLAAGTPCDAIFAACDAIALGAMQAFDTAGVHVPDDIALVGFDGIRAASYASPALSSVEPDVDEAGALLVGNLVRLMRGEPITERRVGVRLIVRASSAPATG